MAFSCLVAMAAVPADDPATSGNRSPWTSSHLTGSPDPPPPLKTALRFPHLKFDQPLSLETDPALQRLWVVTRRGQVVSFPDDPAVRQSDLFVDLAEEFPHLASHEGASGVGNAYGIAFHPKYPEVPVCWVTYTLLAADRRSHLEDGTRLSRFHIGFDKDGIPRCEVSSERVLLTWLEGGHNGACLRFGPDGFLYVSAGDGEVPTPPDPRRAGQDVTNVLSCILRIDVNPTDDGPLYTVPPDNPFASNRGLSQEVLPNQYRRDEALPEIWAYGFRNPWKMNFGPDGQLWVGDVGWELFEMVYNVKPGGNYGWCVMEGPQTVIPSAKRGPTSILPPALAYSHAEGASVTGGFVYRGRRFPQLNGRYVFGDFETRRIWSAAIESSNPGQADVLSSLTDLVSPSIRIVAFAESPDRELLLLDYDAGTVSELLPNDAVDQPLPFPVRLSSTGLFSDTPRQVPAPGVVSFEINQPQWMDHATGKHFVAIPGHQSVAALRNYRRRSDSSLREQMTFPADSVLVKTISLQDDHQQQVNLETQILHFNGRVWNGYTYQWNSDQTDAELVPAEGTDLQLKDYGSFAGQTSWHVHSRSECLRCHNLWVGGTLAFTLPQLNRLRSDDSPSQNQITWLHEQGLLSGDIPLQPETATGELQQALTSSTDLAADLENRARSYLAANCAHCHQNGAGGTATIDLRAIADLQQTQLIGRPPAQGNFQLSSASLVSPGAPWNSVLLYRMACLGQGRMPHIGSQMVDASAVKLIHDWIAQLPAPDDAALSPPPAGLNSTNEAMQLMTQLQTGSMTERDQLSLLTTARQAAPEIRNLLLRFQPAEFRAQQLRTLNADTILALQGSVDAGRRIFLDTANQCMNCHRIGETGRRIGPALDDIGGRQTTSQILESLLQPSLKIDPKFAAWTAVTADGKAISGLIVQRTEENITLRTAGNEEISLAAADLEDLLIQPVSLMPDRLLHALSDQQIADLLAFLSDRKKPDSN
ncbi:MAG: PQQ-dependent sugar dehydrogenase [Planctomycetaceae bacterium]